MQAGIAHQLFKFTYNESLTIKTSQDIEMRYNAPNTASTCWKSAKKHKKKVALILFFWLAMVIYRLAPSKFPNIREYLITRNQQNKSSTYRKLVRIERRRRTLPWSLSTCTCQLGLLIGKGKSHAFIIKGVLRSEPVHILRIIIWTLVSAMLHVTINS